MAGPASPRAGTLEEGAGSSINADIISQRRLDSRTKRGIAGFSWEILALFSFCPIWADPSPCKDPNNKSSKCWSKPMSHRRCMLLMIIWICVWRCLRKIPSILRSTCLHSSKFSYPFWDHPCISWNTEQTWTSKVQTRWVKDSFQGEGTCLNSALLTIAMHRTSKSTQYIPGPLALTPCWWKCRRGRSAWSVQGRKGKLVCCTMCFSLIRVLFWTSTEKGWTLVWRRCTAHPQWSLPSHYRKSLTSLSWMPSRRGKTSKSQRVLSRSNNNS